MSETAPATPTTRPFLVVRDPLVPPKGLEGAVVAIGNFDGVHRGHAEVIARVRQLAQEMGRPAALLTFEPHPADYFAGKSVVFRLTPETAKVTALSRLSLDGVIVLTFDAAVADLSAEAFVSDVLVKRLGIGAAVVGYDFQFGKGRTGSPARLRALAANEGLRVVVVDRVDADAYGTLEAVHSNGIRAALETGDVALAAKLLGHPWFVLGEVVHGQKLGRDLGFPTANLVLDATCRLRHGIYAVRMKVDGKVYDGVTSWGRRPTFDNGAALFETFLFDYSGNLYGKQVEVSLIGWIRGEEKFDSAEALVVRMHKDVEEAKAILKAAAP